MGVFGGHGLKHHHKIYKEDFNSKEEFEKYFNEKIEKIEEIEQNVNNVINRHWDYFENHDLEEDVMERFEKIVEKLNNVQTQIKEHKANLKE